MKTTRSITNNTASVAAADRNCRGLNIEVWATIDSSANAAMAQLHLELAMGGISRNVKASFYILRVANGSAGNEKTISQRRARDCALGFPVRSAGFSPL